MFLDNDKISSKQLISLLVLDFFSTASLTLPKYAAKYGKEDAWIVVIGATVIACIYAILISRVASMFPKETFTRYTEKITNRLISVLLSGMFLIKFIIGAALELRVFGELVKQSMLHNTPIEIIMILMLLIAAYIARKGYEARGRIGGFLVFVAFIPLFIILAFATENVELSNLMPMFVGDPFEIGKGIYMLSFGFAGIELMFIATYYLDKPEKAMRATLKSVLIVGVLNLAVTIITIGTYGVESTTKYIWPLFSIMSVVKVPFLLIDRQDALMMSFWIITVFSLMSAYVFFSSLLVKEIFRFKEQNFTVLPLLPFIYFIALIPDNVVQTYDYINKINIYISPVTLVILPILLMIIAKIRKLGVGKNEKI